MSEGMKSAINGLMTILMLWISLMSYGCASVASQQDIESKSVNFWKPHLLYLQSRQYKSLYVDVQAVEGCEPTQETISALQTFLEQYCDKPDNIRVVRSPSIPVTGFRASRPEILSLRHMNIPESSADHSQSAYLHILFYDSSKLARTNGQAINPHVKMVPYPSAVFVDTQYIRAHKLERHVPELLVHEVGHILGLTWTRDKYSHCSNKSCLMYRTYSINHLSPNKRKQKDICDKCKQSLLAAKSQEPDSRLSFRGPLMVRSEKDYHVLSLPGFMKLHFGPLDRVDWREVLEEARQQVPKLAPRPETIAIMMNQPEPGVLEKADLKRAMASAKQDPCSTVRLGVVTIGTPTTRRPSPYKNTGDMLAKWY